MRLPPPAPPKRPDVKDDRAEEPTGWTALASAPTLTTSHVPAAASAAPTEPGAPARHLGRFVLSHELGRGGMGQVLEALDPDIGRRVAVKVMLAAAAGDVPDPGPQIRRFVAEARLTGQLEHPGIVPVYDVGVAPDGKLFFVMKKVEGRTLAQALRALRAGDTQAVERFTRFRLLSSFVQVCHAVGYAHRRGVLHRDLKPDNVMLGDDGEVLVLDWGIARIMDDSSSVEDERRVVVAEAPLDGITRTLTLDGTMIGTPGYMSAEQIRPDLGRLDARSDVFSLGAILYEILTWQPAYAGGEGYLEALLRTVAGPPVDPRALVARARRSAAARAASPEPGPGAAPEPEPVPDEIAEVCMRALSTDREARHASAVDLARAAEAFLEGARRREEAARRAAEAERSWKEYVALARERDELVAHERRLAATFAPWTPLAEKEALWAVRGRLAALAPQRAKVFGEAIARFESALSHDATYAPARAALARAYWDRLEEAEARRDEADVAYLTDRVSAYDDGAYAARLRGTGALTLRTDPPGAVVVCSHVVQRGLVWQATQTRVLGTTPLEKIPLEMGSYVLTIRAPQKRDTVYPVHVTRGRHWDGGDAPLPLYADEDIGEAFVYVPSGPTAVGGDPEAVGAWPRSERWVAGFFLAVLPVTMGEYCAFLNALHDDRPEEAWVRVPRQEGGLRTAGGQYWERPAAGERYTVPDVDRDGDHWDAEWPVMGVSWDDVVAYVAWRSARERRAFGLPLEVEWEKAARGADGRCFPWGDDFDATLCKMRDSRPGRPQPERVGAYASDVSVYGVRDLAGGVRDWCGDASFDGDAKRRPVRGGSWNITAQHSRLACRNGTLSTNVSPSVGIRLRRAAPGSETSNAHG